jgi:hypothetical protein
MKKNKNDAEKGYRHARIAAAVEIAQNNPGE